MVLFIEILNTKSNYKTILIEWSYMTHRRVHYICHYHLPSEEDDSDLFKVDKSYRLVKLSALNDGLLVGGVETVWSLIYSFMKMFSPAAWAWSETLSIHLTLYIIPTCSVPPAVCYFNSRLQYLQPRCIFIHDLLYPPLPSRVKLLVWLGPWLLWMVCLTPTFILKSLAPVTVKHLAKMFDG